MSPFRPRAARLALVLILPIAALTACASGSTPFGSGGIAAGCSGGEIPVGESEPLDLGLGEYPLVGGECFDHFIVPSFDDAGQQYVFEEFCAALGVDEELNAILGHGIVRTSARWDEEFNGETGALLSGSCIYQPPVDVLLETAEEGFSSQSVELRWTAMIYATFDPMAEFFDGGGTPEPLDGVGVEAYVIERAPYQVGFASISPTDDRITTFAAVGVDFTESNAEMAEAAAALAPEWLDRIMDRGHDLHNAYWDGTAYEAYSSYSAG
jgi:hypothetical protein